MPTINPDLPSNGDSAVVDVYNAAIQAILALVNGSLDQDNLADDAVISSKLFNGSVITTKLADLAVTTAKLADSSVITAKLADGAVTTAKIEAQQAWQSLTLTNGTGSAYYYKDSLGFVHLAGTINVTGTNVALFTLPAGYRPGYTIEFPHTSGGTYGQSSITTAGVLTKTVGGNGNFCVGSASFRAEN